MHRLLCALVSLLLLAGCGSSVQAAGPVQLAPSAPGADGLQLWQDSAIFTPVRRLLDAAGPGQPLWIEMYEFGRADLSAALLRARGRGADVRVIVDRTVDVSARTADELRAAGLPVRAYPVDDRRHQIDHVKLLLASDQAVVGGMNWGQTSASNHDYAFEIAAPAALRRLRDIFLQDWSLAGATPAPLAPSAAGPVAQTAPGEEIRGQLLQALSRAHQSVEAEVFALTDPDVIAALAAARRRGADVRVLLDPGQDVNRPTFNLLLASGVAARWYPVPPGTKLHAKAGLFDGRELLLGSANWSQSGLSVNHELDLLSTDQQVTAAFASRFEKDWSASG